MKVIYSDKLAPRRRGAWAIIIGPGDELELFSLISTIEESEPAGAMCPSPWPFLLISTIEESEPPGLAAFYPGAAWLISTIEESEPYEKSNNEYLRNR
jgi:hypothetical protein